MSGGARETYRVLTVGLEQIASATGKPNVIKMDIEGAEMTALRNARCILESSSPRILCEVSISNRDAFSEFFNDLGYCLYDAEKPLCRQTPLNTATANVIAVHETDDIRQVLES